MSAAVVVRRDGATAVITLRGELDALTAPALREEVGEAAAAGLDRLVLDLTDLSYLSSSGLRTLVYARQKLSDDVRIVLVGANETVRRTIHVVGFHHSVEFSEQFPAG